MIAVTHLDFASEMAVPRQVAGIEWVMGRHTHTPVGNIKGAIASYPVVEKAPMATQDRLKRSAFLYSLIYFGVMIEVE